MRINPRVPNKTADISRGKHGGRHFLRNAVLVAVFLGILYFSLGWIATGLVVMMPLSWEEKLTLPVSSDWDEDGVPPEVLRVFERVYAASESPRELRLFVVSSDDANAFAMLGGHLGLTRGFLEGIESEEELAFVLGHEIGHLEHRHQMKQMARSVIMAVARDLVFEGNWAGDVAARSEELTRLQYSRDMELESDRFALQCLLDAYGHVAGATRFFESIQRRDDRPEFLRTHPLPDQRIEALLRVIDEESIPVRDVTPLTIDLE